MQAEDDNSPSQPVETSQQRFERRLAELMRRADYDPTVRAGLRQYFRGHPRGMPADGAFVGRSGASYHGRPYERWNDRYNHNSP
jgi:hypothetical protein